MRRLVKMFLMVGFLTGCFGYSQGNLTISNVNEADYNSAATLFMLYENQNQTGYLATEPPAISSFCKLGVCNSYKTCDGKEKRFGYSDGVTRLCKNEYALWARFYHEKHRTALEAYRSDYSSSAKSVPPSIPEECGATSCSDARDCSAKAKKYYLSLDVFELTCKDYYLAWQNYYMNRTN